MIQHWQVQELPGFLELAGECDIGLAGSQVAARVIVVTDQAWGCTF